MLAGFRTGMAAEPELYTRSLLAVLLQYPEAVVLAVTEPATGIQSKLKTMRDGTRRSLMPDVAELVEACDDAYASIFRAAEEARRRLALPPPNRPRTLEEQAAIDAQVEAALGPKPAPGPRAECPPGPRSRISEYGRRVVADLAARKARNEIAAEAPAEGAADA